MRKALLVGINDYSFAPLQACIPDAHKMYNILSKDFDDTPNFYCKILISSDHEINKENLSDAIIDLYSSDCEVALFYFSGHGSEQTEKTKACLVTQDAQRHTEGVLLEFLMEQVAKSKAKENVIILDCCFSGGVATNSFLDGFSILRQGTSVLTSSHHTQVSFEDVNGGVFTSIIYDALNGGAADTTGLVNVASIYSFADKLLGPWEQRPIFKANVTKMTSLRKCKPIVPLEIIRKLPNYFSDSNYNFPLDPTFEPEVEPKGHDNEKIFADLQKYNRASLLIPIGEEHMYHAAINSKSCELTPLGRYYWQLAKEGKL